MRSKYVQGVINYRGTILTVIDLKQRLLVSGTASSSDDEDDIERLYTLIIKSGDTTVGVLVDYVESVVGISDENIKATLDLISSKVQSTFLSGVAKTELGLTILLSINIWNLKEHFRDPSGRDSFCLS
ncbi:hypothetical protein LCGC14_2687240 [marine sediment metagenome]|uniref:CheW-like domain-containing protein n=1 Tax=marine sediment metagenome TaxID=412755 RepID=A0A0F8ZJM3_9ZZZZ